MSRLPWLCPLMLALTTTPAQELVDPTRPAIPVPVPEATPEDTPAPAGQPEPLQLHSILIGPGRRVAVIDGRVLTRGEEIRGARLVAIEADRVELERGGETLTLTLTGPKVQISPPGEETP